MSMQPKRKNVKAGDWLKSRWRKWQHTHEPRYINAHLLNRMSNLKIIFNVEFDNFVVSILSKGRASMVAPSTILDRDDPLSHRDPLSPRMTIVPAVSPDGPNFVQNPTPARRRRASISNLPAAKLAELNQPGAGSSPSSGTAGGFKTMATVAQAAAKFKSVITYLARAHHHMHRHGIGFPKIIKLSLDV